MSGPDSEEMLAAGGGHATAAGFGFEAQLDAMFACQLLAERPFDSQLGLGTAHVKSIRFETEAPVDDILIEAGPIGYLRPNKDHSHIGQERRQRARKDSGHCNLLNACQSAILNIELRRPLSKLEPGKFENIWR